MPGAAPSPEFVFSEQDGRALEYAANKQPKMQAQPSVPLGKDDGVGKGRIAGIQALMSDSATESTEETATERTPESSVVAESGAAAEVSFDQKQGAVVDFPSQIHAHLGLWFSERFVLISGVSDQASTRLQDTLAKNVLAAVGETRIEKGDEIRWPVFGNPRVPGNSAANFRDTFHSLANDFGARKVVLLGVLANDSPSERDGLLGDALGNTAVDFAYTLAELAAVPLHKRELWQRLKSIAGS